MPSRLLPLGLALLAAAAMAEELTPDRLGVVFSSGNAQSARVAEYYALQRGVPLENLVGINLPARRELNHQEFEALRAILHAKLPASVQSLLLVWSQPFAVECMSITTAFAAGYRAGFCATGCERTDPNPLYDAEGWLPADTTGWLPAMLLPSEDEVLAHAVIERGKKADGSRPPGSVYLIRTADSARDVRATGYADAQAVAANRVQIHELMAPPPGNLDDIVAYFTGAVRATELPRLHFRPGAVADHLTSFGGVLDGSSGQMSALEWLRQGAIASYGNVSEPCNMIGKFPSPAIFLDHYLRGATVLEAYWKSVAMPGQGLFIGEPLSRPYAMLH